MSVDTLVINPLANSEEVMFFATKIGQLLKTLKDIINIYLIYLFATSDGTCNFPHVSGLLTKIDIIFL